MPHLSQGTRHHSGMFILVRGEFQPRGREVAGRGKVRVDTPDANLQREEGRTSRNGRDGQARARRPIRVKTEALDTATGLPASIEAAWGLRERPGKAAKPWLSLERIVAAAVGIAETEGLGAVAMSRVAADLGAATMSLYRYVAAKDELLALMVDSTYGPPPGRHAGEPWREGLSRWAWAQHSALRKHSWVVRVPITEPPSTPNQIAWLEAGLACLADTGLDESTKLSVILLIHSFLRSEATLVAEINAGIRAVGSTSPQAMAAYGRLLAQLTNPGQFPALRAVIDAGVFDQAYAPDSEFAFGLDRLLDGIETMIATRCRSR